MSLHVSGIYFHFRTAKEDIQGLRETCDHQTTDLASVKAENDRQLEKQVLIHCVYAYLYMYIHCVVTILTEQTAPPKGRIMYT